MNGYLVCLIALLLHLTFPSCGSPDVGFLHENCRRVKNPIYINTEDFEEPIERVDVPDAYVKWKTRFNGYDPKPFESPLLKTKYKKVADPHIG